MIIKDSLILCPLCDQKLIHSDEVSINTTVRCFKKVRFNHQKTPHFLFNQANNIPNNIMLYIDNVRFTYAFQGNLLAMELSRNLKYDSSTRHYSNEVFETVEQLVAHCKSMLVNLLFL